jgi:hypothetical protein
MFNLLRVAICVAALWIVVRGVTLEDHVSIRAASGKQGELVGLVVDESGPLRLRLASGEVREIPLDEIAVDRDGAPRIAYGLQSAWRKSNKSLLFLAALIYFPVVFPLAQRFRLLLRAQNIHLGYSECVRLTFAGNFLNYATPLGSNAGDLFKAYFASLHTPHKTEAVTTVVLDRIIGLGTLLAVVASITAVSPGDSRLSLLRPYMFTLLAIGVVAAAVYFSPIMGRLSLPTKWRERLPVLHHVGRVDQAVRTVALRGGILFTSLLLTVVLQLMALASYFVVAIALAMKADAGNMLEYFAYFYTGALVQALPGPPQGLGTVELAYRFFFAPYGSASQIVCMAFAIRLVGLICALPGLLVTLTGSYKPREIEAAIAKIEGPDSAVSTDGGASKRDLVMI